MADVTIVQQVSAAEADKWKLTRSRWEVSLFWGTQMSSRAEIYLDLEDVGAAFTASQRRALLAEIQKNLQECQDELLSVNVEGIPVGSAKSKTGELMTLGGLALAVTAAGGYSFDPAKTKRLLEAVWKALRKFLSKGTEVRIASGGTSITISTSNEDTTVLLDAAAEVASRLDEKQLDERQSRPKARAKRVVTFTPKKR